MTSSQWIYYHNPRCSKSRQGLEQLKEAGVELEVVEYLKTGVTQETAAELISTLNGDKKSIIRVKEAEFKETGLDISTLSAEKMAELISATPKILERPILTNGKVSAIGRPTENMIEITK